jgi:hypothetical protein
VATVSWYMPEVQPVTAVEWKIVCKMGGMWRRLYQNTNKASENRKRRLTMIRGDSLPRGSSGRARRFRGSG